MQRFCTDLRAVITQISKAKSSLNPSDFSDHHEDDQEEEDDIVYDNPYETVTWRATKRSSKTSSINDNKNQNQKEDEDEAADEAEDEKFPDSNPRNMYDNTLNSPLRIYNPSIPTNNPPPTTLNAITSPIATTNDHDLDQNPNLNSRAQNNLNDNNSNSIYSFPATVSFNTANRRNSISFSNSNETPISAIFNDIKQSDDSDDNAFIQSDAFAHVLAMEYQNDTASLIPSDMQRPLDTFNVREEMKADNTINSMRSRVSSSAAGDLAVDNSQSRWVNNWSSSSIPTGPGSGSGPRLAAGTGRSRGRGRGTGNIGMGTNGLNVHQQLAVSRGGWRNRGRRGRGRGAIARARIDWDRIMAMKMPSDNTKKYGWIAVSCLSGNSTPPASNIVPINKNEFVLATEVSVFPPFGGIYKYSTLDNAWTLIWEYPEGIKFMRNGFHALSFDEVTNELYLYGTQAEPHTKDSMICKISLYTFKHQCIYVPRAHGAAVEPNTVIMNGKLHAVGGQGFHRSTHSIYDIASGKFEKSFAMWEDCAIPYGLIGIESRQWILGFSDCTRDRFPNRQYHEADEIWMYDMSKARAIEDGFVNVDEQRQKEVDHEVPVPHPARNEEKGTVTVTGTAGGAVARWERLWDVVLPFKMVNFGFVTTFDEKYLIIFGGVSTEEKEELWGIAGGTGGEVRKRFDGIYILDLDTMVFHGCDIRCPTVGDFDAVMMSAISIEGAVDLVSGYVKEYIIDAYYDEQDEYGDVYMPMDVLGLLSLYCKNEYIYLMQRREILAKHWKICVDDVLNAMTVIIK